MGLPFLNPSVIAQGVKPVEVPDPMEQMQAIERLRQARNQNALAPLHAQELSNQVQETAANMQRIGLANDKARRDQADDEEYQKAIIEAGPDPDKQEAAATKISNPVVQAKILDTAFKQRERQSRITARQHDEFVKLSTGAASDLQAIDDAKDNAPLQLGLWSQLTQRLATAKDETGAPLFPPGTLDPTKAPDSKTIKVLQSMADKTGEYHSKQAKLQDEADKTAKAKAAQAAKDTSDLHVEADTTFQGMSKEQMPAAIADFASQDPAHAAYAKRWLQPIANSDNAGDIIHKRALTADQRDKNALTQQERDRQDTRDEEIERHNRAMELEGKIRASRENGQTANSIAVDRRKAQTDLNKAKEDEERLATLRANLENAINSGGKTYVNEKGVTVAMSKAKGDEQDTAENLTQRMRSAYQDATNKLKRVVADKNTFGQALGMGITVPTEAVHAALDADNQRVLTPKPKAAAPVAQPVATPSIPIEGTGMGAIAAPTPSQTVAAPAPQPAQGHQSVSYKGTTYTVGQEFNDKVNKRRVRITGFKDGKPLTQPVE